METRRLGNSELWITPIGVGAWAMGGSGWTWSWGPQNDSDSLAAIDAALDHGINWIDTAAVYGLGHSEEVVGRALRGRSQRPYVFTKCERTWDENGKLGNTLKAESIRRECEASLSRLGVDVIDLYQIHWPEPDADIEEGWTEMARLREEGKVRNIGVSNFNVKQMKRAAAIAPITSLQPPYSMLARGVEESILPFAAKNNIGVIVYSPMYSGLLSGGMTRLRISSLPTEDWRLQNPNFREPLLSANLRLVELLREIGERHGRTPGEVAIAWTLHNPAVTGAIVGVRNPKQVSGVIGTAAFRLESGEFAEIERALQLEAVLSR
ncbi:MAG TPA: aldo/keto reductase [Candidatus Sulfotelmatobacter sp.]|jgi:aryl-alcohol dehydrogenase-like predicted oxidoreductase